MRLILMLSLRNLLKEYSDNCELTFGSGNLTFYRVKSRGNDLVQIDFNEDTSQLPDSAYPQNNPNWIVAEE